jgi:hypothetical protein
MRFATLGDYPNCGICADHIDMTKFHGPNDVGYQSVSSKLWLWANKVETEVEEARREAEPALPTPDPYERPLPDHPDAIVVDGDTEEWRSYEIDRLIDKR